MKTTATMTMPRASSIASSCLPTHTERRETLPLARWDRIRGRRSPPEALCKFAVEETAEKGIGSPSPIRGILSAPSRQKRRNVRRVAAISAGCGRVDHKRQLN